MMNNDSDSAPRKRKLIVGQNDLATLRPDLVQEWDYEKNKHSPQDYTVSSNKKVRWKCSQGHEWQAKIYNRTKKNGNGCPFCSGRKPIVGQNDFATLRPDLIQEWDYEKNKHSPQNYTVSSGKKVWWKCPYGHEWQAKIHNRTKKNGSGCPHCAGKKPIVGQTDLATLRPDLANEWNYSNNEDFPQDYALFSNKKVWWKCSLGHEWQATINNRSRKRIGCPYCSGKLPIVGQTDLATLRPDLAKEWDYSKNEYTSQDYTVSSRKKVCWKCAQGHKWQSTINNRTKKNGNGCPFCSGRKPIVGQNDLATLRPDLIQEWDYEKNKHSPQDYTVSSGKKVCWKCSQGHEWQATIYNRTHNRNCPYCSGKLPIVGQTDLATLRPDLAKEWNYSTNEYLPKGYTVLSNKKVWWKCSLGHEWQATISSRSKQNGHGCPYCSGRLPIIGQTDLATLRPDLAKEWDFSKNTYSPKDYTLHSDNKVWWICLQGHNWPAAIKTRTRRNGTGCPFCAGHKPIVGETDLATLWPELAEEWDYSKNKLSPQNYTVSSGQKVWWICPHGHKWQATIASRVTNHNCPYCVGRKQYHGRYHGQ